VAENAVVSLFFTFFPADFRSCGSPLRRVSKLLGADGLGGLGPLSGTSCAACGEVLASPLFRDRSDARCAFSRAEGGIPTGTIAVITVPLPAFRSVERRFNQAEMTARVGLNQLANRDGFELCANVPVRRRATASQIGLTRHPRREGRRAAFAFIDHANHRQSAGTMGLRQVRPFQNARAFFGQRQLEYGGRQWRGC